MAALLGRLSSPRHAISETRPDAEPRLARLAQMAGSLRRGDIVLLLMRPAGGPGVVAARELGRAVCTAALAGLRAAHGLAPYVSRSATPGLAAIALATAGPVGVDVEQLRPELVDADLLDLALHADERRRQPHRDGRMEDPGVERFFAIWTRKEAVMKALGVGLALAPASFDAGPRTADWHRVRTPAGSANVRSVTTADGSKTDARFAAALATTTAIGAPAGVHTVWLDDDAVIDR